VFDHLDPTRRSDSDASKDGNKRVGGDERGLLRIRSEQAEHLRDENARINCADRDGDRAQMREAVFEAACQPGTARSDMRLLTRIVVGHFAECADLYMRLARGVGTSPTVTHGAETRRQPVISENAHTTHPSKPQNPARIAATHAVSSHRSSHATVRGTH
jgi:hypothetical protein